MKSAVEKTMSGGSSFELSRFSVSLLARKLMLLAHLKQDGCQAGPHACSSTSGDVREREREREKLSELHVAKKRQPNSGKTI